MYLLSFFGSPRKQGVSSEAHRLYIRPFIERGIEVKEVPVHDLTIRPCLDCGHCRNVSECPIEDDVAAVYDLIRGASAITVSSPIYFTSLPGQFKMLIDRCQVFWEEKRRCESKIPPRAGGAILSAGAGYAGVFGPALTVIRHWFNTINCALDENDCVLIQNTDNNNTIGPELAEIILRRGEGLSAKLARSL